MFFTDQLNRKIELAQTPKRIVSLVPSQTELLYDLGLRDEVVGITKFCIHPEEWFRSKTRIGGTKKIDFEKIKQLNPDLIIGNKEENEQSQIEELMKHYSVWMSDINCLKDAFDMITRIGTLVGKLTEATFLKLKIEHQFNQKPLLTSPKGRNSLTQKKGDSNFTQSSPPLWGGREGLSCAYFIWKNPFMVAGKNTFINDMLMRCGFENVFASVDFARYPEITEEQIADAKPELILLSSEPYPFKEQHIKEFQHICPKAKIAIVDGELFSWYGSRLLKSPSYFNQLIQSLV